MGRRRGRGRGQGNRGRKSGRAKGSVGGGSKGKGKSKGGASSGRRGGQGNRGRKTGRAKGTVSRKSIAKGLSRVGNVTRQLRQPVTGLSSLAIRSVLNNPAVARSIAQYGVNTFGEQNRRTRDMSQLSPQQQRKYQRLSEKTGRDYSVRKPTFRLNMNMRDIAKFAGLDKSGLYNRLPSSIRNAQVNKQFYGNPIKKGWHSSQRTGRGQGVSGIAAELDRRGIRHSKTGFRPPRGGPEPDWLSQLYSSHNISGGKLDQGARDYWTNEAKTRGRDTVMQTIIGTAKAQGTYGGRKKPRRISTGSRRKDYGYSPWAAAAISAGRGLIGGSARARRNNKAMRQQNRAAQKSYDLQTKGYKRRHGMLAKTIAATMAARGM